MYKIIAALLIMSAVVYASNFGSSVKINPIEIKENQTAEFSLLFWTSDEKQEVTLEISKPDGWAVTAEKPVFEIGRDFGNEMIYSPDYMHATSVKIFADPRGSGDGDYTIMVRATTKSGAGLNFAQERIFNLNVVIGDGVIEEAPVEQVPLERPGGISMVIILVVVFISVLIYKYS